MDSRRAPRTKKRMTCVLYVGQRRYSGIVLDVSATGVFVQTGAATNPGDRVQIEMAVPGAKEKLLLGGSVARLKRVPPQLKTVAQGGIGVRLDGAPEAYFTLVASLKPEGFEIAPEEEKPAEAPVSRMARKALQQRLRKLRAENG